MKTNDAHPGSTATCNSTPRSHNREINLPLVLLMTMAAISPVRAITIGGTIGSTRWTSNDSPILVVSNVLLPQGSMLILDSGVTMKFTAGATFTVRGTLAFGGEVPVVFTTDGPTTPGYWKGLKFSDQGGTIIGGQCVIEYAETGISGSPYPVWQPVFQMVQLNNSTIRYCKNGGITMFTTGYLNSSSGMNLYGVNICSNGGSGIVMGAFNGTGRTQISGIIQNCVVFSNSSDGIQASGDAAKPAITRNVICGNGGTGIGFSGPMSNSITENIVVSNAVGILAYSLSGSGGIYYNDVWSNGTNWVDQATNYASATGNISMNPLFADPASGDFHLRSIAGRYEPLTQTWVHDDVTSPCVDAGDPASAVGNEPQPNGNRINLGSDAGTTLASKSHTPWLNASVAPPSQDFILSWASVPGNNYQVLYGLGPSGPWSDDLPGSQLTAGAMVFSLSFTNPIATDTNLWFRVRMTPP